MSSSIILSGEKPTYAGTVQKGTQLPSSKEEQISLKRSNRSIKREKKLKKQQATTVEQEITIATPSPKKTLQELFLG